MSKYIPLDQFLQKYTASPVEFKMYIGFRIQSDPEFGLHEIGGESKEVIAKNNMDDAVMDSLDKIENGDRNLGVMCDIIDKKFVYQIKINKIANAESDIIGSLKRIQDELPEMLENIEMNGTIDDILIIDAWNEYNINDRFCIKKA